MKYLDRLIDCFYYNKTKYYYILSKNIQMAVIIASTNIIKTIKLFLESQNRLRLKLDMSHVCLLSYRIICDNLHPASVRSKKYIKI